MQTEDDVAAAEAFNIQKAEKAKEKEAMKKNRNRRANDNAAVRINFDQGDEEEERAL